MRVITLEWIGLPHWTLNKTSHMSRYSTVYVTLSMATQQTLRASTELVVRTLDLILLYDPRPQISPCRCGKTAQWAKRLQHKHVDLNLDPPHSHPKLAVGASIGNIIAHCTPKSCVSSLPTVDSNGDSMVALHMSSLPVPQFPFVHPEVSPHPPTRT